MVSRILYYILVCTFIISCNQEKKEANVHNKGEITLQFDDSYINIAETLSYRYEKAYPETKINLKVSKEDQALEDLLNRKVDLIIMSRELTEQEKKYWDAKTQKPFNPSFFAADAVCFIVNKKSAKEFITLEELKEGLSGKERKFIFEDANTSNFNAVIQKVNLEPEQTQFYKAKGNEEIIKNISQHSNYIGAISYNTISNPYSEKAKTLKESVKILPIKVGDSLFYPNKENLKSQKYPLTKLIYFITNEDKFGLANGFMRYSCTSIGQKIVGKEGLQPYYLFPRTIKIKTQ